MKRSRLLFGVVLALGACPALAQETYGPPAPVEAGALPADMPDNFSVDPGESLNDAYLRNRRERRSALRWHWAFQALNLADAVQTIAHCSGVPANRRCEANPIYGSHPSTGKVLGIKAANGLLHHLAFRYLFNRDPRQARKAMQISAGLQGGVVIYNMTVIF